jgi:hypothetical protein
MQVERTKGKQRPSPCRHAFPRPHSGPHATPKLGEAKSIEELRAAARDSITAVPLVLAMNEASESGISYEDVPYVAYEYPITYRRRMAEGTPFVYYRGRKRAGGGRQVPAYIGAGIVGSIRPSTTADRLVCEVLDGRPFTTPVPFKADDGTYLEPGGNRPGYYVQGVRVVSEAVFADIVGRGVNGELSIGRGPASPGASGARNPLYADASVGRVVEEYSRKVIVGYLESRHPQCSVWQMPLNNPGYDLATDYPSLRFVEVKGTQAGFPRFAMSEGERRFGEKHRDAYLLAVVYGIDLAAETHLGIEVARAPLGAAHRLEPLQWAGQLGMS